MGRFYAERVAFTTPTTGTGSISIGSRLGTSFKIPSETAIQNSDAVRLLIQEGDDVEIVQSTYSSGAGGSFSRDTVIASCISGTWGTTKITLAGAAEVRILPPGPEDIAYFAQLNVAQTFSAKQTFSNFIKLQRALEKVTITADNPASGDNNFDLLTQSIQYYTTNCDTNFTLNVRGDGSNSLDSLMAIGEIVVLSVLVTNGATPYYMNALKIDTSSVAPKWLGGATPSAGNANSIDEYLIGILKTASTTFTVFAQQIRWA